MKGGDAVILRARRATVPEPNRDVTCILYECEEIDTRVQRPAAARPRAAPRCCRPTSRILHGAVQRRGRGRLPGHAAGRRAHDGRARAQRAQLARRQRHPRAAPILARLDGVRAAQAGRSTGSTTTRASTRSRSAGGVAGNVIPDECVVDGQLPVRPRPERGARREAHVREMFAGYDVDRARHRAAGARPASPARPRRPSSRRSAARSSRQVRLDRRRPLQRARGPGGELRPRRPEPRAQAGGAVPVEQSRAARPRCVRWLG